MGAIVDRIKEWWQQADQTQKLVTGFGLAFLLVILGFTVFFATRPTMQAVFTGMTETDKAGVYDELVKGGFKVEISGSGGEVMVPTSDVPRAKMLLATKNKLPKGTEGGIDIINSIGIGDSQVKEREKVLASKERELESSIGTMKGVESAQVHLNLGKDAPFNDEKVPASASIRITEENSGIITSDQAKAMSRLVEFAITGLKSSEISVITDDGRMLFDGKEQDSVGSIANRKIEAENLESRRRTDDLQRELDRVFGRGNTIADIDVTLDMDATNINKDETITGSDPLYKETGTETMDASGGQGASGAGFESNGIGVGAENGSAANGNKKYESSAESIQYPSSNTKTQIQKAAGDIVAMNIMVTANSEKLDAETIAALETRVQNYIAPWAGQPEFAAAVTPVKFNSEEDKAKEKAQAEAAASQRMQQLVSLMPVGALLVIGFILTKSLGKALKKSPMQQMVLSNGQTINLPAGTDPELLALIESAGGNSNGGALPQLGGSTTNGEEEDVWEDEETGEFDDEGEPIVVKKKKKKKIHDDDEEDDDVDVAGIKRKVDVPLEQIKKMAKKNPEAVAMLLKSWVLEERS